MAKLSDDKIAENMARVQNIVSGWDGARRKAVAKMFSGPIGEEYFTAPASSREDYHGCFPGGLCDHSLRVVDQMTVLAKVMLPGLPPEEIEFLGLMHDLGKVGDEGRPLYIPNSSTWHKNKGILYETNHDLAYMPICDRTMYLLQKYGITVNDHEYIALRISDGPYEKSNEKYNMKEPDLALLVHFADRWACQVEKANP